VIVATIFWKHYGFDYYLTERLPETRWRGVHVRHGHTAEKLAVAIADCASWKVDEIHFSGFPADWWKGGSHA
jgi:hypothetical protein